MLYIEGYGKLSNELERLYVKKTVLNMSTNCLVDISYDKNKLSFITLNTNNIVSEIKYP